jgi:hypothetical protein
MLEELAAIFTRVATGPDAEQRQAALLQQALGPLPDIDPKRDWLPKPDATFTFQVPYYHAVAALLIQHKDALKRAYGLTPCRPTP